MEQQGVYKIAFQECRDKAGELLQDEAVRRAHEGVLRPVYHRGVKVGVIREYSDQLLIFLLKGWLPDVYGARREIEWDGDPAKLSRSQLEKMIPSFKALTERAKARANRPV